MSRLILSIQVCLIVALCSSVALGEFQGYEFLWDWESLASYKDQVVAGMASSYDRTGDNLDINYYELPTGFQDEDVDPVTVVTVDGPGVLTRFWMPHYTANSAFKVRMYVDGGLAIDTNSDELLGGQFGYMDSPLVSTMLGGQVSYEPIAFAESLKIESENRLFAEDDWSRRHYYQYNYQKLPPGTQVAAYTGALSGQQQAARDAVVGMINNVGQNPAGNSPSSTVLLTGATSIAAGQSLSLSELTGSGTIRRLNVKMSGASDAELDGLRLRVRYDGQTEEAIDVPVSHFFGAGHERVAYKSLPLGTDSVDGFYSYWPMPFHKGVEVELYNQTGSAIGINSAAVEYEAGPVSDQACYLYTNYDEELTSDEPSYHTMLEAEGAGHYVGNLLYVQRDGISRNILEGDEVVIVDGVLSQHGTGLEDAYNGGYYYNHAGIQDTPDDPPRPESGIGPYHGLLHMDDRDFEDDFVRTDQYRWLIGDFVPFTENIEVKIENIYKEDDVLFGSSVFYYLRPDLPGDVNGDGWVAGGDLSIIISYWGQSGLGREFGDLDGNGTVDGVDYTEVLSYWGSGTAPEPPSGAIPEPASIALLLAGGLILLRRRRSSGAFVI